MKKIIVICFLLAVGMPLAAQKDPYIKKGVSLTVDQYVDSLTKNATCFNAPATTIKIEFVNIANETNVPAWGYNNVNWNNMVWIMKNSMIGTVKTNVNHNNETVNSITTTDGSVTYFKTGDIINSFINTNGAIEYKAYEPKDGDKLLIHKGRAIEKIDCGNALKDHRGSPAPSGDQGSAPTASAGKTPPAPKDSLKVDETIVKNDTAKNCCGTNIYISGDHATVNFGTDPSNNTAQNPPGTLTPYTNILPNKQNGICVIGPYECVIWGQPSDNYHVPCDFYGNGMVGGEACCDNLTMLAIQERFNQNRATGAPVICSWGWRYDPYLGNKIWLSSVHQDYSGIMYCPMYQYVPMTNGVAGTPQCVYYNPKAPRGQGLIYLGGKLIDAATAIIIAGLYSNNGYGTCYGYPAYNSCGYTGNTLPGNNVQNPNGNPVDPPPGPGVSGTNDVGQPVDPYGRHGLFRRR